MVTKKARRLTKKPRKRKKVDRFPLIETALRKLTKAELVETIMVLAKQRTGVARGLENELNIEKPAELLIEDVGRAIAHATDFDERMINHNFDVRQTSPSDGTTNGMRYSRVSIELAVSLSTNRSLSGSNSSQGPSVRRVLSMSTPLAPKCFRVRSNVSSWSSNSLRD